jgi:apoptosis-inducing factor 3
MAEQEAPSGPDLRKGVSVANLAPGGMIGGHVDDQPVLIARVGDELLAIGGSCTHYGAPLAKGIVVGDTVRCPWHHACFSLRTGEALGAPALFPVKRWKVERSGDQAFVSEASDAGADAGDRSADTAARKIPRSPSSVVIVGAGAAGDAAAEMLRRRGYAGSITMVGDDDSPPVDRPNLSKEYLSGDAPEEWIPLRPPGFYDEQNIRLMSGCKAASIDTHARRVKLEDGTVLDYGALLLATGASPVKLPASVDPNGRALYLRTLADSRKIIAAAEAAKRAVVLGASFIGLEVAASLTKRGVEVHVVAPDEHPLERVLGRELSDLVRATHEKEEVVFHLGRTAGRIDAVEVVLDDGSKLPADLVVAGIGVRPREELAKEAGLTTDKGIVVDAQLRTSAPDVYAAGDVARYPDPRTGQPIRIEHWMVAQRMGQAAARSILGIEESFELVPFFWSRHFDAAIDYVGHAEKWDEIQIDGDVQKGKCTVKYVEAGRVMAVATVGRERASLEAERQMQEELGAAGSNR